MAIGAIRSIVNTRARAFIQKTAMDKFKSFLPNRERTIAQDGTEDNSQSVLTLLMATAETLKIPRGRYWIEVTTPGSTSVDSMVLITGSDS